MRRHRAQATSRGRRSRSPGSTGSAGPGWAGHSYVTTILLTDIVDSTATLARVGRDEWDRVLTAHFDQARRAVDRHRGIEIKTLGDGMLATFDGAARAVRAAFEMHAGAASLGIRLRAGVHTGEVDAVPGNIRGMAVHIAARVAAAAQPGETLVTATTREIMSADDLEFEERGAHELKGVTGARALLAARPQ